MIVIETTIKISRSVNPLTQREVFFLAIQSLEINSLTGFITFIFLEREGFASRWVRGESPPHHLILPVKGCHCEASAILHYVRDKLRNSLMFVENLWFSSPG